MDDPYIAKIFNGTTPEEKFEVAVLALGQFARVLTLQALRLDEILERLEAIERRMEAKSWVKAINAEIERREREGASSG